MESVEKLRNLLQSASPYDKIQHQRSTMKHFINFFRTLCRCLEELEREFVEVFLKKQQWNIVEQ